MAIFHKTLTIGELLNIDNGRVERSKNLEVKFIGVENMVRKMTWLDRLFRLFKRGPKYIFYKVVRYQVKSDSGNVYTVLFKIPPGFDINKFYTNRVEVFCTCPDFKYRAAYNLNQSNNLLLIKATREHLGDEPLTVKPTKVMTTPICKHIYACIPHLRLNLKKLDLVY